jgi:replicative DNA helicase
MDSLADVVTQEQIDIERLFAGAVLIAGGKFARDQAGWLNHETIMHPEIREWWKRVQAGEDPTEVGFALNIASDLLKWSNQMTSSLNIEQYANSLTQKNYIRTGLSSAEGMAKAAGEGDVELMRNFAETFLNRTDYGGSTGMRDMREIGQSLNARIEKGDISIPWGIETLDVSTRGLERGTMTVLAARPSMGKSSLAFQVCETMALEEKEKVGVFALEMSGEQMMARRTCHKIDRMWMDVRAGLISEEEEETLKAEVSKYADTLHGRMWVNDSTDTTVADIVRTQLRERYDVIMIDHLGLLKDRRWSGERHDQYLGRLTEILHSLAKNTNSVVILVCQLNRGVEQRTDKRPHMGDLRDSGNIEQNSDNVALLYGEWYYNPEADPITEVILGKFRDGKKNATAYVEFNMQEQHFDSVTMEDMTKVADEAMNEGEDFRQVNMQSEIPF